MGRRVKPAGEKRSPGATPGLLDEALKSDELQVVP